MPLTARLLTASAMMIATPALASDIVLGEPNWPSAKATAHVLKEVIEQNIGLEVELQNGTNPIIFEAMDSGAMHVHPEVWLPNQQSLHDAYVVERGTVVMNENGVEVSQGICVPRAVSEAHGITSVEDLTDPAIAALFDSDNDGRGEMWIGVPGWASTSAEQVRARSYGYDQTLELTQSDEALAFASLDSAIKAGEPWVGFCSKPHFVHAIHDLVVLDEPPHDPKGWDIKQPTEDPNWLENSRAESAWPPVFLNLHYAAALKDSHPDVARLFRNFKLDADMVSEMSRALAVDKQNPDDFARQWVAANEGLVLGWLTD